MSYRHKLGRHIIFISVVCPSVCLSRFSVCSILFESRVEFSNISAQLSSTMRWFALLMFYKGWFKVIFIVQCLTLHYCILCMLYKSWRFSDILKWLGTNVKYHATIKDYGIWHFLKSIETLPSCWESIVENTKSFITCSTFVQTH